jgi:NADH-quinone oxidoreductase subunit G
LIPAWERGNTQGLWDNGALPAEGLMDRITSAKVLLVAGADPAIDDPTFERALEKSDFVIVQELFKTATAQKADVVFPVLAYTEREGTYTSGERRVQRFYPAVPAPTGLRADYEIAAGLGVKLGLTLEADAASLVFRQMAEDLPQYNGLTYPKLAETTEQWPIVGREDVYYGGTTYANKQGLGVQLPLLPAESFDIKSKFNIEPLQPDAHELAVYPYTRLLDTGVTVTTSPLLSNRLAKADLRIHPVTAKKLLLADDMHVMLPVDGAAYPVRIVLDDKVPEGTALIPRSVGVPIHEPQVAQVVPGRGHND